MSTELPPPVTPPERRRRFAPVVWGASALAAAVLVLGVSGTLSSWTQAIVTNNDNSVASTKAVSLSEASGGTTCVDTATTATNTATCTTINKYGGTATPLDPDAVNAQAVTVTLKNTGTETGSLTLGAGVCTSTPIAGSNAKPGAFPLCDVVTVAVSCTGGASYTAPAVTLSAFAAETSPRAIGSLASTASTDCTFTLTLPSTTPPGYASQVASQVLTWTLSA